MVEAQFQLFDTDDRFGFNWFKYITQVVCHT